MKGHSLDQAAGTGREGKGNAAGTVRKLTEGGRLVVRCEVGGWGVKGVVGRGSKGQTAEGVFSGGAEQAGQMKAGG